MPDLSRDSHFAGVRERGAAEEDRLLAAQLQALPDSGVALGVERRRAGALQPAERGPARLAPERGRAARQGDRRGQRGRRRAAAPHRGRALSLGGAGQSGEGRRLRVCRVLLQQRDTVHEFGEYSRGQGQFPCAQGAVSVGQRQ